MSIGKEIRRLRKELNLTQKQLSSNICAQTLISKIENDEIIPNAKVMKLLSERLKTDLISLNNNDMKSTSNKKIEEIKSMIDLSLTRRDYNMIDLIIKSNTDLINSIDLEEYKFYFSWIKGLLYYYKDDNPGKAIDEFDKLNTCELPPDFAVDVTCSIGIVHYEVENFEKAKNYFEKSLNWFSDKIEIKAKVKLLINYSLCLESLNKNERALELIFQGIELSKKNNSMFALGDLYYHKGFMLSKLKQYEEAVRSYKIAHSLFEVQENSKLSLMASLRIDEIKNKELEKDEKNYA